jgi:hypothetical protein
MARSGPSPRRLGRGRPGSRPCPGAGGSGPWGCRCRRPRPSAGSGGPGPLTLGDGHEPVPAGDAPIQHRGLVGERPVQGVHAGAVGHGPDADPDRPAVVVQDVELVATLIGRHGMGGLEPGVTDSVGRRLLVQGRDQPGPGVGPRGGEQGDRMAAVNEAVGEQRDHPLDPTVAAGRDGIPGRSDESDAHGTSSLRHDRTEPGYPVRRQTKQPGTSEVEAVGVPSRPSGRVQHPALALVRQPAGALECQADEVQARRGRHHAAGLQRPAVVADHRQVDPGEVCRKPVHQTTLATSPTRPSSGTGRPSRTRPAAPPGRRCRRPSGTRHHQHPAGP